MHNSDLSVHRAIVHNSTTIGTYVKIPSILGPSESVAVFSSDPSKPNALSVGDQVLVAVEGDNLNRVYVISNINLSTPTTQPIDGGSA